MPDTIILFAYFIMWYWLVGMACLFFISGLDDLLVDIFYWVRYGIRLWTTRKYRKITYQDLSAKEEQWIAVLVPCWHEAGVIGVMLRHNCYSIDYQKYRIFVGVYPNDPATIADVEAVAKDIKQVHQVIGLAPGPTTKAANLNGVYLAVKSYEKEQGITFAMYVFHDSEDIIHPMSFKFYNYLIPEKDMIQVPIFPLSVPPTYFTHWVYADEFSEVHTKDVVMREAMRGHVPSAGVGTAFSRHSLQELEDPVTKTPFETSSLTEDYRTSLNIRLKGLKQIFLVQQVKRMHWVERGWFKKKMVMKVRKEYIATRALFPTEYIKSVRQKSRWIIGIVFQESLNSKWPKSWPVRLTLAHDRKSIFTHFINGFGYFVLLFWMLYSLIASPSPSYPKLQEQFNFHPWIWYLVVAVSFMMVERLIQRMIALWRVYHEWVPTLLAVFRIFYGNIINMHAILRAFSVYFAAPIIAAKAATEKQPVWDKTDHEFPGRHLLVPYKRQLGDLLVEKKQLSHKDVEEAMAIQYQTGARLGDIFVSKGLVTERDILEVLSEQYQLDIVSSSGLGERSEKNMALLPEPMARWLSKNQVLVAEVSVPDKQITIAISDPTNELLIDHIMQNTAPFTTTFVLYGLSDVQPTP